MQLVMSTRQETVLVRTCISKKASLKQRRQHTRFTALDIVLLFVIPREFYPSEEHTPRRHLLICHLRPSLEPSPFHGVYHSL